jgi:hypothetical protein
MEDGRGKRKREMDKKEAAIGANDELSGRRCVE